MILKNVIANQCINFLKTEEAKKELKDIFSPVLEYFLKEINIYLYFFIFFIFTSFILHLGVLLLLIRYNFKLNKHSIRTIE
jgi:hypothetical protein|uniref:Uncharacterized protein n=1 Tax=viral metagenome TaxID=1070528 RepID=A0A6C0CBP3_9ZZZZ